jgi:hypothetical protein
MCAKIVRVKRERGPQLLNRFVVLACADINAGSMDFLGKREWIKEQGSIDFR